MRRRFFLFSGLAVAAITLIACVKMEIDDHSYQFNEATGSTGLRLLLLNAVRASKDYPLQFSKINTYQGTGTVGGSISADIPVSSIADGIKLTPKIDIKPPINQLALVDLNTEEAQQALKKQASVETFRYYFLQRGTRAMGVINAALVESVYIHEQLYTPFVELVKALSEDAKIHPNGIEGVCGTLGRIFPMLGRTSRSYGTLNEAQQSNFKYICRKLVEIYRSCEGKGAFEPDVGWYDTTPTRIVRTKLIDECHSQQLTVLGLFLLVTGFDVKSVESEKGDEGDKDGKEKKRSDSLKKECKKAQFRYQSPKELGAIFAALRDLPKHLKARLDDAVKSEGPPALRQVFEEIMRLLGNPATRARMESALKNLDALDEGDSVAATAVDLKWAKEQLTKKKIFATDARVVWLANKEHKDAIEKLAKAKRRIEVLRERIQILQLDQNFATLHAKLSKYFDYMIGREKTKIKGEYEDKVDDLEKKDRDRKDGLEKKALNLTVNAGEKEKKDGDEKSSDYIFRFAVPFVNAKACAIVQKDEVPLEILFRSPERMVRYLGELIAVQNFRDDKRRFVPKSLDVEAEVEFDLLRVVRGAGAPGRTAVAIRDPDGEWFHVPKPEYGSKERERSLELLGLVADVLNGAVSKKSLPQVSTFTLAPSP